MKRIIATTLALALSLTAAAGAFARHPGPDGPDGPMGPGNAKGIIKMVEELGLTPDQKSRVALILKDNRDQAKSLREVMRTARERMGDVMMKTPGDENAVRAAVREVSKAGEELAVHAGKVKAQIDGVLTPEQKTRLEARKDEFRNRFKDRHDKGGKALDDWIEQNLKG